MSERTNRSGPKIGIVGFGRMAEMFHVPGLKKAGWRIESILDVTELRREVAVDLGVPRVCSSMKEFLETEIDAALVSTHSSVRKEVIAPLARSGRHLMVEKPIATTAREGEALCCLADENNVLLTVYHNRRFDPDAVRVRELVESGFIGRPFHVENRLFAGEPATAFGAETFNQKWRETASLGGGTMLDWGVHLMDQTLTLMRDAGKVVGVSADVRNVRYGDADDHFLISVVFENGDRALVGKSDVCPLGPPHKWLVVGENGSLVADWDCVNACNYDGDEQTIDSAPKTTNLHRNFREAVEGRAELLVTAREALRVIQVFDAARRSARNGGKSVTTEI